jgi:S-adenosylmethionine decarboxylase
MLHLLMDIYNCDPGVLGDEARLRRVIEEIPRCINMQLVGPVTLRYIKTSNPLDDGYSGLGIIATSHVSLHAWVPYRMVNLDVFSCEPFEVATVIACASETFGSQEMEVHVVERATRSPRQSAALRKPAVLATS